jgi:hypothetical protein
MTNQLHIFEETSNIMLLQATSPLHFLSPYHEKYEHGGSLQSSGVEAAL